MLEWISNDCRKIKSKSWPDTTNANNQEPEITHGKKRTVVKKKLSLQQITTNPNTNNVINQSEQARAIGAKRGKTDVNEVMFSFDWLN